MVDRNCLNRFVAFPNENANTGAREGERAELLAERAWWLQLDRGFHGYVEEVSSFFLVEGDRAITH